MPFRPQQSLLNIDVGTMHTIDTRSVENLFGMWSVFSKASEALEDGKRLENLSWRLWNRETFCCCPETQARSTLSPQCRFPPPAKSSSIPKTPELASSVDSVSSEDTEDDETLSSIQSPTAHIVRPELRRVDSNDSRSRGREKHITPVDLEKMVISIKEKKVLQPLEPLPLPAVVSEPETARKEPAKEEAITLSTIPEHSRAKEQGRNTEQEQTSPSFDNQLETSTSTMARSSSNESHSATRSDTSSSTAMSSHNVVRGFVPGGAPSSYRSQTQLAPPPTTSALKTPNHNREQQPRKKKAMFTIGTSSGEDEGSLDKHMYRASVSSISEGLHKPLGKKASFRDNLTDSKAVQDSPVFESDDEEDDDVSDGGAIEDDEDSSDEWEDELAEEGPASSIEEQSLFQRVGSRPNLTSRRSALTSLMHEPDRAKALANAASRSAPAYRRSRATSPSGPSRAPSPQRESQLATGGVPSHPRPIIMTTSNTHQLALSPRTTRRNMLSTELTESLRKNLLWERQHKSSQNIAALKRHHTSTDVKNLKQHPEPKPVLSSKDNQANNFSNDYFHAGLGEYHAKGW